MDTKWQEEVMCPGCNQVSSVRRKLLTSPFCFEQPEGDSEHMSIYMHPERSTGPVAAGFFINGYFCDTCSIGFVTHKLLQEVGTDESHTLRRGHIFVSWRGIYHAK